MNTQPLQQAALAGGCFWCLEAVFDQVKGVTDVFSGYSGGKRPNPSYEQVCTGLTGHAESVQVTFDPALISFTSSSPSTTPPPSTVRALMSAPSTVPPSSTPPLPPQALDDKRNSLANEKLSRELEYYKTLGLSLEEIMDMIKRNYGK